MALETAAQSKRPLVVIAADITQNALAVLLANHLSKNVKCIGMRIPGYGNVKTSNAQDLIAMS